MYNKKDPLSHSLHPESQTDNTSIDLTSRDSYVVFTYQTPIAERERDKQLDDTN